MQCDCSANAVPGSPKSQGARTLEYFLVLKDVEGVEDVVPRGVRQRQRVLHQLQQRGGPGHRVEHVSGLQGVVSGGQGGRIIGEWGPGAGAGWDSSCTYEAA